MAVGRKVQSEAHQIGNRGSASGVIFRRSAAAGHGAGPLGSGSYEKQQEKRERREARERREYRREDGAPVVRRGSDYWDAARYYRQDDRRYRQRRLGRNDRIYRGSDSRYYCKRDDGTTGLIIGGISGAVLGTIIAPGESKVLGTIIGAGAGALIGRAIDDGDVVCR